MLSDLCFHNSAHRTAGYNTPSRTGGNQKYGRAFKLCGTFVRQGSVPQRHCNHIAFGLIDTLFNRFGNVVRFAEPVADAAFLITDNRQRGKGKAAAALYDFGGTVQFYKFFNKFFLLISIMISLVFYSFS